MFNLQTNLLCYNANEEIYEISRRFRQSRKKI